MIHFKFTRKNVRRLCVTMALIAPIVYLFGSLFTGLNGAHGQQIFADGEETSQKSYDELMDVENFNYGAFDWSNEHGTRVGFSLGRLIYVLRSDDSYIGLSEFGVSTDPLNSFSTNYGLGFSSTLLDKYFAFYLNSELIFDECGNQDDVPLYCAFYCVPSSSSGYQGIQVYVFEFLSNQNSYTSSKYYISYANQGYSDWDLVAENQFEFSLDDRSSWVFYFDDGAHLPEGLSWNDELASYFVPKVKATEMQTYSDYVFGQFFARDNFVSKIGEDAISETPHGFAPFGSLFRYIDQNALHMGDTQVGLMAYGYMYWCAHVLLFDVLFMMTTFFISFIERVGDRLGGNE